MTQKECGQNRKMFQLTLNANSINSFLKQNQIQNIFFSVEFQRFIL